MGKKTVGESGGRDPRNVFNASEDGLTRGGGVHCRTQEINTLLKGFAITQDVSSATMNNTQEKGFVGDTFQQFCSDMYKVLDQV